ncbi:S8 family serine peptidase [Actinomadura sp. NAK00032]|uniref:S8 family serine peptidase n=1 Tax=Actinomadura sp. NAK00032 TaxID=2742128 RepID=UPI0015916640|nr:S8 family serine peptidase [Actinomadura sp. NAK00032]QKW32959.1 S8 family serine peptidase [Actinomadura sp. NAK00032]
MTHRRRSRALLGLLLAAGALAAVPPSAQAAPSPSGGLDPGKAWKVTLLTGDAVSVRTVKGRPPLVSVTPAPGREKRSFRKQIRPDGHVVVTPVDVAGLVGRVLDPELFDVTALIAQGYDDARSKDLPLIVQREKGARPLSALGGTLGDARELPSIGAVAVRQPKDGASGLGKSLAGMRGPSLKATGGIRHIWLDGKVKASFAPAAPSTTPSAAPAAHRIDRNLRQIGAPAAWRAGYTGKGAKVAVLDTGADAGHPDLKERIADSENFSESPDTVDRFGHGTHVASTIAGTGAAAEGEHKGVAPDADLLIGKVLDDDGYGTDSSVIAGMQWAAPRADIVNMSLGGAPSDGSDPVSLALTNLTAEHGALFVVAAGNDGTFASIGSPGTAEAALTVGAVDGRDRLADFSSRGPVGISAKPEIVAPGVDIEAARAAGTAEGTPTGTHYTKMSGTSMATPHVAGAAALLAAKHPDWTPARIKAALVGTADPATGGDAYRLGAGRLDIGETVRSPVLTAQGIAGLGTSKFPGHPRLATELGWTSATGRPVDLRLSVEVTDREGRAASGVATVPAGVTVPAGGTGKVPLTVDASRAADRPGLYTAVVTAKGGGAVLETPVTFFVEPPTHTLTLKATPLPDTDPANFSASATVVNLDDHSLYSEWADVGLGGETKLRVPAGRYAVLGNVDDFSDWRSALAGDPEVVVDRDVTVTLDGAAAVRIGAGVEGVETATAMAAADMVQDAGDGLWSYSVFAFDPANAPVYVQPMEGVTKGTFKAATQYRLTAPGAVYDIVHPLGNGIPADPTHTVTAAELTRMARVDQKFAAFDGDTGAPMSQKRYGISAEGLLNFEASGAVEPGTSRTDYVSAGSGMLWGDLGFVRFGEEDWVDQGAFRELKPGERVAHRWGRQPLRPGPYSGTGVSPSFCARYPTARTGQNMRISLVDLQARPDGFDCSMHEVKGHLELFAGDQKIGAQDGPFGDFSVPSGPVKYRLSYENDASAVLPVSIRTSTSWTFRSRTPRGGKSANLPLLLVDYDLNLDMRNRPAGEPAVFTVARQAGSGEAKVTGLRFWTSADDGKTWQDAEVTELGGGRYSAPLPAPVKGQAVSLRVSAKDAGGSGIDQSIVRAYRIR